jgi:uncharacterized membrane protein YcgQ (UPF0703/DUF1980 family)
MKLVSILVLYYGFIVQPSTDGWDIFAKVKFTEKFFKDLNEYYMVPFLDSRIKFYEGKEITLEGYFLPYDLSDKNSVVISRNPFAACFFCGGAGPESVAEIVFSSKPPRFKADQIITITGILKLNDSDINHMNFILENAKLETDSDK